MKQKAIIQSIGKIIFRLSIYVGASVFALFAVFGNPDTVKQAFVMTKAYSRFVPAVLEDNSKSKQVGSSLSLEDAQVQKAINQSFPPALLQANAEMVINSTYNWLNGQSTKPNFVLDFGQSINTMADRLSLQAMNRLELLPVCAEEPKTIDPFRDNCRPEFYDFKAGQASLAQSIRENNGIFAKAKFTVDDLPKNANGKNLVEQYPYAPKVFALAQYAHWLFLLLALQGVVMIMYAARKKREAVKYLSLEIMSSGAFLALTPIFYIYILPRFFGSLGGGAGGSAAAKVLEDVTAELSTNLNSLLILVGVLIALTGLALLLLERGTRPRSKYLQATHKAGMASSEPIHRQGHKFAIHFISVPIQTSEGTRDTGKFHKDKKYRKVPGL